jgi:hypothetical protein
MAISHNMHYHNTFSVPLPFFLSYVGPFILFKILVGNMQNYKLLVFSASTINMVYKITRFQSQIGLANKNTKDLFWFMPLLAR